MASLPIVNIHDKRVGIVAAILFMILLGITLYLIKYTIADPPPKPYVQPAVAEMTELEFKNLKLDGGTGGGTPSDDPVDPTPKPQTEQVLTKPDNPKTSSASGKSNKNTSKTTKDNPPSTTKEAPNPFGDGGQKGGKGGGTAGKFGNDNNTAGPGKGPTGGGGDAKDRIRLNDPQTNDIASSENHKVSLRLTIDQDGKVVDVRNISSMTTTVDQRIINQVIAVVKNQVRYNKKPGAELQQVFLTVNINAN